MLASAMKSVTKGIPTPCAVQLIIFCNIIIISNFLVFYNRFSTFKQDILIYIINERVGRISFLKKPPVVVVVFDFDTSD